VPARTTEYQRLQTAVQAQLAQLPGAKVTMSRNEPDISAIEFGSDGNLWVSNSRSGHDQPAGIMFTWDVFTPDGEFIRQVSAKCAGDGKEDSLIWTPDGNAVLVTGFLEAAIVAAGRRRRR
jgi:sugar lactone lactonase YvrE